MPQLILIVEDEPKIARLARDYLENAGFDTLRAGDGQTGLAAARTEKPDLVVLDLNLPELTGLDATRALRRDEGTRFTIRLPFEGAIT